MPYSRLKMIFDLETLALQVDKNSRAETKSEIRKIYALKFTIQNQ